MINEAIILAGGFGTRLAHVLGDVPKPMAPVAGKPFLTYLLDKLQDAGVKRVVMATGYKHDVINKYFGDNYKDIEIIYSQETQPLFTGGAILQATQYIKGEAFFVFNGDTLFTIDLSRLSDHHISSSGHVTIALRQVADTSRYGAVRVDGTRIVSFEEKNNSCGEGVINGGIYVINKDWLINIRRNKPEKFSFEKEVLQQYIGMEGLIFNDYFIDIGIHEDYHCAQRDFPALFKPDLFLFLDRDGVINRYIDGGYVCEWNDFEWLPNMKHTLADLTKKFRRIFVVTNQQGVGKGCFSQATLDDIHRKMLAELQDAGVKIDSIYVCTSLESEHSPNRKPEIGMALQAKSDFPEIDFYRSVMVGDALSDMRFGYKAGMRCVYITRNNPIPEQIRDYTDVFVRDLAEFALL